MLDDSFLIKIRKTNNESPCLLYDRIICKERINISSNFISL